MVREHSTAHCTLQQARGDGIGGGLVPAYVILSLSILSLFFFFSLLVNFGSWYFLSWVLLDSHQGLVSGQVQGVMENIVVSGNREVDRW